MMPFKMPDYIAIIIEMFGAMQVDELKMLCTLLEHRYPTKLTKNLYTKQECARLAKCTISEIEEALEKGTLSTAKNQPDKVRKSSLETFLVVRKK